MSALVIGLWTTAATGTELCRIKPVIYANGSVLFDGALFSDPKKLEARLIEYKKHNPGCLMSFVGEKGTHFEVFSHVFLLAQKAGFSGRVGFLTEPRNTP